MIIVVNGSGGGGSCGGVTLYAITSFNAYFLRRINCKCGMRAIAVFNMISNFIRDLRLRKYVLLYMDCA